MVFPFNYLIYRAFVAAAVVVCLRTPVIYGYNTRPSHIAYTYIIIAIVLVAFILHLFQVFLFFLFTSQLSVQTVIGLKKLNQKRQKKISSDHIIPSQFLPLNQSPQSHLYCSGLFVLLKHFLPFKHGFPVSQMVWETNKRRQKSSTVTRNM